MPILFVFLFLALPVKADEPEFHSLDQCIERLRHFHESVSRSWPLKWIIPLDRRLHYMVEGIRYAELNAEKVKAFVQSSRSDALAPYLVANSTSACEAEEAKLADYLKELKRFLFFFFITTLSVSAYGAFLFTRLTVFLAVLFLPAQGLADLSVYTYDSLAGKGSLGQYIQPIFEQKYGTKIRWVTFGSSGETLSQFLMEGKTTTADVLLGVDQSQRIAVLQSGNIASFPKETGKGLMAEDRDPENRFLPFDYGYLAFVYDSRRTKILPKSLEDFSANAIFHKKVVIEDPRTSSLGLGFLVWVNTLWGGKGREEFWSRFSRQLVTVAPGWSAAYGMFLKKEADFVLSYTTSPAYHREEEKVDYYKAVYFPEGHYRQIEYASIVKSSQQKELALRFLETLVSKDVQTQVPLKQWMYPALENTPLPASFHTLSIPKSVKINLKQIEGERKQWIRSWTRGMVKTAK